MYHLASGGHVVVHCTRRSWWKGVRRQRGGVNDRSATGNVAQSWGRTLPPSPAEAVCNLLHTPVQPADTLSCCCEILAQWKSIHQTFVLISTQQFLRASMCGMTRFKWICCNFDLVFLLNVTFLARKLFLIVMCCIFFLSCYLKSETNRVVFNHWLTWKYKLFFCLDQSTKFPVAPLIVFMLFYILTCRFYTKWQSEVKAYGSNDTMQVLSITADKGSYS